MINDDTFRELAAVWDHFLELLEVRETEHIAYLHSLMESVSEHGMDQKDAKAAARRARRRIDEYVRFQAGHAVQAMSDELAAWMAA